ncbi:DUF5719 family protein [Arthrobacter cavernae]|uniref:Large extracellular alpha-helical protein n=1 Tax=Arthrobacter cavernae TaxID=2817681 RepID=A0A939HC93_9MICC|nr:DUF5719 family protein [Arthrobacter cavernae]MBO1266509.1 hypothetical protein [Arthrobacter cavernae]
MSEDQAKETAAKEPQTQEPKQPKETEPQEPRQRRKAKGAGRGIVTGVLSAVVILAAGGGVISAASLMPESSGGRALEIPQADVPAGHALGVCPEPARLLAGTADDTDAQFNPVSQSAKTLLNAVVLSNAAGTIPGSAIVSLGGASIAEIAKKPTSTPSPVVGPPVLAAAVVSDRPVASATVTGAEAIGNEQASMAAHLNYTATDGDLRGEAATSCPQPGNDSWLLGASTALGRTAVLNISNASGTPATANLDIFGAKGQIQVAGARGLLVPPGTTRSINLGGLAPGEAQLAVRLRSSGGPVAGTIQQSVLRGLTPGGIEFLAPGNAPSNVQVMSGVDIQDPAAVKALGVTSGFADASPALQIAVPGAADAVVQLRVMGTNGERPLPNGGAVTAKGGSVTTIPLDGVPAGNYTVSASSDVAFVASARVTRGLKAEEAVDFAWSPSAARLGSQHIVAVPREGERFLSFGVPEGRATISLTPVTVDGKVRKTTTSDIAGGTTAMVKVPEKVDDVVVAGYIVSSAGDAAYGALVLGQAGRSDISVNAIQDGAAGHEKIPVTVGY